MKREIINKVKMVRDSLIDRHRYNITSQRNVQQTAPYPTDIYDHIFEFLTARHDLNFPVFTMAEHLLDRKKINVFARHDIDTLDCVRNLPKLLRINEMYNTPASFYFRVDDEEYELKDHRDMVELCLDKGFEVGLHTACYVEDDYMERFRNDTLKFEEQSGHNPTSFTVHGLGSFRRNVRQKFYHKVSATLEQYGYTFSDCHYRLRKYDYIIEDCHYDVKAKKRFIYDEFTKPGFMSVGKNYLILTHPCYWQ